MEKKRQYKKKFVLLSWENGDSDVIPLSCIPKNARTVGVTTNLTWENYNTNQKTKSQATILKIGEEAELQKIIVNESGKIYDKNQQIFKKAVVDKQKLVNEQKKIVKGIKSSNAKQVDRRIGLDPPIHGPPALKRKKSADSSGSPDLLDISNSTTKKKPLQAVLSTYEMPVDNVAMTLKHQVGSNYPPHFPARQNMIQQSLPPVTIPTLHSPSRQGSLPPSPPTSASTADQNSSPYPPPEHQPWQMSAYYTRDVPQSTAGPTNPPPNQTLAQYALTPSAPGDPYVGPQTAVRTPTLTPGPYSPLPPPHTSPSTADQGHSPTTTASYHTPEHKPLQTASQWSANIQKPSSQANAVQPNLPPSQDAAQCTPLPSAPGDPNIDPQAATRTPTSTPGLYSPLPPPQTSPPTANQGNPPTSTASYHTPEHQPSQFSAHMQKHPLQANTVPPNLPPGQDAAQFTPLPSAPGNPNIEPQTANRTSTSTPGPYSPFPLPPTSPSTADLGGPPTTTASYHTPGHQSSTTNLVQYTPHQGVSRNLQVSRPAVDETSAPTAHHGSPSSETAPYLPSGQQPMQMNLRSPGRFSLPACPSTGTLPNLRPELCSEPRTKNASAPFAEQLAHDRVRLDVQDEPIYDPMEGTLAGTAQNYDQSVLSDDGEVSISDCDDEMAFENNDEIYLSGTVTLRDIQRQKLLLAAMERAYEQQQRNMNTNHETNLRVFSSYFVPGENKKEMSQNCGVYLPTNIWSYVVNASKNDWQAMVRNTLLQMYGSNLVYFSTTGKRTSKPSIDKRIFIGLLGWANQMSKETVSRQDMVQCISKFISNKAKYVSARKKQNKIRD